MRSEVHITDSRKQYAEVIKNLHLFPDPAQILKEIIECVEWLNEEGDRTTYYYYFIVEGHEKALEINAAPKHLDIVIEPPHYVSGYESAKKAADMLAYFYQKPVSVLEDNTEIIVYIAKSKTYSEWRVLMLERHVMALTAERDAVKKQLDDINDKFVYVPRTDIVIRSLLGLDEDADISHISKDERDDICRDAQDSLYDIQWEYTARDCIQFSYSDLLSDDDEDDED